MRIELVIGPMYSGKTTEAIRRVTRYKHATKKNYKIGIIKPKRDTRSDIYMCTHKNEREKANFIFDNLKNKNLNAFDILVIDEAHFFGEKNDLFNFCKTFKGKTLIINGLDTDWEGNPFIEVVKLVSIADKVDKLTAVCECGDDAIFSGRITNSKERIVVGGKDIYKAMCRECFNEHQING